MLTCSNPLLAIVTGMEHSGTTFLSNALINNIPNTNSAFECGLLLSAESPRNFHEVTPFYDWLCLPLTGGHWGLSEADREYVVDTDDWGEAYSRLMKVSEVFTDDQKYIIDKTPGYAYHLKNIKEKIDDIPVFVVLKKIELSYASHKKRNVDYDHFERKYNSFVNSILSVKENQDNLYFIWHHDLSSNLEVYLDKICKILKVDNIEEINYSLKNNFLPLQRDYDLSEEIKKADEIIDAKEYKLLDKLNRKVDFQDFNVI